MTAGPSQSSTAATGATFSNTASAANQPPSASAADTTAPTPAATTAAGQTAAASRPQGPFTAQLVILGTAVEEGSLAQLVCVCVCECFVRLM